MGKFLGSHASEELDRPDLNKCPDCGCFFATETCPLCGKICPEEMRAGNRKRVKHTRERNSNAGRVVFVEWYHSWVCIILALIFSPIIGIILLATSPHKRSSKVAVIVIGVIWFFLSTFGIGMIMKLVNSFEQPVDYTLSAEEYMGKCETLTAEQFYRDDEGYVDEFVSIELTVDRVIHDSDTLWGKKYTTYYICSDESGPQFSILVRDCRKAGPNLAVGDRILVYGEGAEPTEVYDINADSHSGPCLNMAYCDLIQE